MMEEKAKRKAETKPSRSGAGLGSDNEAKVGSPEGQKIKKQRRKKPRDMPRRPLSAYNYFFREERARWLAEREKSEEKEQGSLFSVMGKTIAQRWKNLASEEAQKYKDMAAADMDRYRQDMDEYHAESARRARTEAARKESETMSSPDRSAALSSALRADAGAPRIVGLDEDSARSGGISVGSDPQLSRIQTYGLGAFPSIYGAGSFGGSADYSMLGAGATGSSLALQQALLNQRQLLATGANLGFTPFGGLTAPGIGALPTSELYQQQQQQGLGPVLAQNAGGLGPIAGSADVVSPNASIRAQILESLRSEQALQGHMGDGDWTARGSFTGQQEQLIALQRQQLLQQQLRQQQAYSLFASGSSQHRFQGHQGSGFAFNAADPGSTSLPPTSASDHERLVQQFLLQRQQNQGGSADDPN